MTSDDVPRIADLQRRVEELQVENDRLRSLLGLDEPARQQVAEPWEPTLFPASGRDQKPATVDKDSAPEAKIALFCSLFVGREDVYARRWENSGTRKAGWSPAVVGGWANAKKPGREYETLTPEVVGAHLAGGVHVGLYPLLRGDTCRLLACDFDGAGWALDALAYLDAARAIGVPVVVERSRSGDGAHAWTFFSGPVPAASARRVGVHILREAMTARAEIDLSSYDRLFPTQDFMPKGSFGNLIALPLNGECRRRATTVFLDPATLDPYEDQWAFLSSVPRISAEAIATLAETLIPVAAGPDDTRYRRPRNQGPQPKAPEAIRAELKAMLEIDRVGVPPALLAALKHLASLHNPDYYEKERLRFSTWNTPRFLRCYGETMDRLLLPRGVRAQAEQIVTDAGSRLDVVDGCREPEPVEVTLRSELTDSQRESLDALAPHDLGVLVAPPGSGKTVVACGLIAQRHVPTLVIVDRQPLVEQWRERLVEHLGIDPKRIGQLGGGRNRAKGFIDIAMAQSLTRRDDLGQMAEGYGLVIVDECHHVPAVTFERCVRQIAVSNWLGLTATPYRRDGLQSLISMYCGPVRHRVTITEEEQAAFDRALVVHPTAHVFEGNDEAGIQEVFAALVEDDQRSRQICGDIVEAAAGGRNCLVLTQRKDHVEKLAGEIKGHGCDPIILQGGMGKKSRTAAMAQMHERASNGGLILVATGSFLGEGFDCPPLDTLFLAFPMAFKGRTVQYVGRVLRPTASKSRVEVHDYVDTEVPVLARMHSKRLGAYSSLGFRMEKRRSVLDGSLDQVSTITSP